MSVKREPRELDLVDGARAPLFDRLIDLPESQLARRNLAKVLNKEDLKRSIRWEIEQLLNSRCSYPTRFLDDEEELTVIDYGIPDLSNYSPQDGQHQKTIAAIIRKAISTFEPRLQNVEVNVEAFFENKWALLIQIEGQLVINSLIEPVSFPLIFKNKTGVAQVDVQE